MSWIGAHLVEIVFWGFGGFAVVAAPLFDTYLIPFEITSLLLLAAVVGAVVLAKRKL